MGDCNLARRSAQRVSQLVLGNDNLWNLPVIAGASEDAAGIIMENHMQNDVSEHWVGGMAMKFPAQCLEIQLDWSRLDHTLDLHSTLEKIRAGTAVPLAELNYFDIATIGGAELSAKCTSVPQRLDFEFAWQAVAASFFEC
jgi:hypothetical protein